jgi:hypothetical protein
MDDVLKNNPMLARQMAQAAAAQAGPGFGNFMGMAMGVPPAQGNGGPASDPNVAATGAFFGASGSMPAQQMPDRMPQQNQRPTARREMSGPSGVDDILKTFDEVRAAEAAQAASGFQMASGVVTQPAVAAVMTNAMDDARSAVSGRSGMTGGTNATGTLKPRRRRAQPPVGNEMSIDA